MKYYGVVLILSMLDLSLVDTQEDYWPVHTVCESNKIQVTYRSCGEIKSVKQIKGTQLYHCWLLDRFLQEYTFSWEHKDPIQDVGFTLTSCSDIFTQPYVKASFLLRQTVDELYLSVELFLNGVSTIQHDEPVCLPNFPRFTFCGNRRGEMIAIQSSVPGLKIPLKGHYNIKLHAINQKGFQIVCVNATAIFM